MARAIAMALAVSVGGGLLVIPVAAHAAKAHAAQTTAQRQTYHIPAERLRDALDALAAQSNIQIAYAPELVQGKSSPGLSGAFTPTDALHRLLRGTGLTGESSGTSAFVLKPEQAADDPHVKRDPPQNTRAQTKSAHPKTLQAIVVTGSLVPRAELQTANPVITVGRAEINATGDVTLGKLIQHLPAVTGGASNPQFRGSKGGTKISLRGLGPQRTLILVNGHRVVSSDVSSIPSAMIGRIEVLKDGAAVVYGSDAIGGVINFITRKQYNGARFSYRFGQSKYGDGFAHAYNFTIGHSSQHGTFFGGVGYSDSSGVRGVNRPRLAHTVSLVANKQGMVSAAASGSTNSPYGHIQIPASGPVHNAFANCSTGALARNPSASGMDPVNDYHCYINFGPNSDQFDFAVANQLLVPQRRSEAFFSGTYNLANNVSLYLNAYFTKTDTTYTLAPALYSTPAVDISAQNYYNPFGINFSASGYGFRSRAVPLGFRTSLFHTTVAQLFAGMRGVATLFDHNWQWDLGVGYGHVSFGRKMENYPNFNKLWTGPSFLDRGTGQVVCGTRGNLVPNCDATFDPFNLQSPGSGVAMRDTAQSGHLGSFRVQRTAHALASGGLFALPSGAVRLGMGVSYRQNATHSSVGLALKLNPSTGSCVLGSNCSAPLRGGFDTKSAYAELFVPILSNVPWVHQLNLIIGDRYSQFSVAGSTNSQEYKLEWRPTKTLLVRGSVEDVFRTPTVGDLFAPKEGVSLRITRDPCDGYTGSPVNPACVNVPKDGSFADRPAAQNVSVNITRAGAVAAGFPLGPEQGKSFDLGLVFSPEWLPGLSLSADVWHIYLNDVIHTIDLQSALNLCSNGQEAFCGLIHRQASGPRQGQITRATLVTTANLGSVQTGGVDVHGRYTFRTDSAGRFDVVMNATYLKYYNAETAPGEPGNITYHYAGHFMNHSSAPTSECPSPRECLFPRLRVNGTILWRLGNWSASWKLRYIGGFRMGSPAPSQDTHPAGPNVNGFFIDYGSTIYSDVSLGYNFRRVNIKLRGGVNNLFNKKPPYFWNNNSTYSVDATNFDVVGRYYWVNVALRF